MQARLLGVVALKVWGVFLVARAALGLVTSLIEIVRGVRGQVFGIALPVGLFGLFYLVLTVVVALLIFRYAEPLMARLLPDAEIAIGVSATELMAVALGVLGVYLVVEGSVQVVTAAVELVSRRAVDSPQAAFVFRQAPSKLVEGLVQTVIGVCVASGRNGVAQLWVRLRGRDPVDTP